MRTLIEISENVDTIVNILEEQAKVNNAILQLIADLKIRILNQDKP